MNHENVQRYPLSWPVTWKRTPPAARQRASFAKTVTLDGPARADGSREQVKRTRALSAADATGRLQKEIDRLNGHDAILSTNLKLRLDGVPRSDQGEPMDPGAAVYFTLNKKPICLACDKWDRVADNIAALAQHIDALRRIDRYGVGSLEQAFAGYQALPAMATDWWVILGVSPNATLEEVEEAFRAAALRSHPDRGGTHEEMARLSEARRAARAALTVQ